MIKYFLLIALLNFQSIFASEIESFIANDQPSSGNPHVLMLDFSEPVFVEDEDIEEKIVSTRFLIHFKNLISLNLYGCNEIRHLDHISSLVTLQQLDISCCHRFLFTLDHLSSLKNLRVLKMERIYINEALYSDPRRSPTVEEVDALPTLDWTQSLTNLERLFLSGNHYLRKIHPVQTLPNLQELDISGCDCLADVEVLDTSSIQTIKRR